MFQTLVEVTEIKKISNLKGGSGYHLYIFKKKKKSTEENNFF